MRSEGFYVNEKFPVTPAGIEPVTFRLVAQNLLLFINLRVANVLVFFLNFRKKVTDVLCRTVYFAIFFSRQGNPTGLDDRSPTSLPLRLDHRPR